MAHNPLSPENFPALPFTQKSIAFGSITSSYALVGSVFSAPPVIVYIISTLDETVQFSWDGVNAAFPVLPNSGISIDFRANGAPLPVNYAPYVKQIGTPTEGSLYVCGFSL